MRKLIFALFLIFPFACQAQTPSDKTCGNPQQSSYVYGNHFYICVNGLPQQVDGVVTPAGPAGTAQISNGTGLAASDKTTIINGQPIPDYLDAGRQPLASWLQYLHNSATTAVDIKFFGDSYQICDVTLCAVGPTASINRWPEQLRVSLQAAFGYGGTGMMPLSFGNNGLNLNSESYTSTGTVNKTDASLGPSNATTNGALVHLATGATVTFQPASNLGGLPYDHLIVYCETLSGSGSLAVVIDGGSSTPLTACNTPTGSATAHAVSVSAGSTGYHVAVVTSTGDSYIYAMKGKYGTTGVQVSDLGYAGADVTYFGGAPAAQLAFSDVDPDGTALATVSLLQNDVFNQIPLATFTTDLTAVVTHELGLNSPPGTPAPSVMLAIPPVSGVTGTITPAQYTAAQMAIYVAQPIDVVNIQWQWGPTQISGSPLWGAGGNHPSDKGAVDEAAIIWSKMVDNTSLGGPGNTQPIGGPNGFSSLAKGNVDAASFGFNNATGGNPCLGLGISDSATWTLVSGCHGMLIGNWNSNFLTKASGIRDCWNSATTFASGTPDTCFRRSAADEVTLNGYFDSTPTGNIKLGAVITTPSTPADNATCTAGQMYVDTGFVYFCTASGTVKRAALSTF